MGQDDLRGITIGGRDLATYLNQAHAVDTHKVLDQRHYLKKGSRVKYMDHTEPNGRVKRESQHNLNIINLESNLQKATTNYERTIAYLLTGQPITSKFLWEKLKARDASAILNNLYRSGLGKYIEREDLDRPYYYTMNSEGCNLTPKQALGLYRVMVVEGKETTIPNKLKPQTDPPDPIPATYVNIPQDININITVRFIIGRGGE